MKLLDLFNAVKDHELSKEQLELYRDELASLYAEMHIEMADLEKKEAMFMLAESRKDKPMVHRKAEWKVTEDGQRLITLKNYIRGTSKVIDSLKSRLYSIY